MMKKTQSTEYPQADVLSDRCPSRGTLGRITTRWSVLVFLVLSDGTHRFSELRNKIGGISEKMLAQTLHLLTDEGLVSRFSHDVVPPRVEYTLTQDGQAAAAHVLGLARWIEARQNAGTPPLLTALPDGHGVRPD